MTIMKLMNVDATSQSETSVFAELSREELLVRVADLADKVARLTNENKLTQHQLDWFKRQLFGEKR